MRQGVSLMITMSFRGSQRVPLARSDSWALEARLDAHTIWSGFFV